jgi:hypothetical protein
VRPALPSSDPCHLSSNYREVDKTKVVVVESERSDIPLRAESASHATGLGPSTGTVQHATAEDGSHKTGDELASTRHTSTGDTSGASPIGVLFEKSEYALRGTDTHGVIAGTKREFQRCEDEQIHIPGAIQSYGC